MKRIKKVVLSALTLMMSIFVMCVGVYAAASAPKVSISGSISYDVGACKVRVIGNLYGAYLDANGSGTTPVAKTAEDDNNQPCHYYGVHDNAQSETNMLPAWDIGSVYFKETADGAESFVISLMVENLSAYPIKATINNTATEDLTNVSKQIINNEAIIGAGGSSEIQIKYDVTDSSKQATLQVGNELAFEKTILTPSEQSNWTYRLEEDNKVSLLKYTGSETEIVVPSKFEIDGTEYPVYSVGDSEVVLTGTDPTTFAPYVVFSNLASPNTSIASVVVSEGIESIGAAALGALMGLQKVSLPNSLKYIKAGAFAYSSMQEVYLPDSVQELGYGSFIECNNLSHVALSNNLQSIQPLTFYNCPIYEITIPKSVTDFGQDAFYPRRLKSLNYLGSIEDWCKIDFGDTLTAVQENSPIYNELTPVNLLFNYSLVTEITIPTSIETINTGAFAGCTSIKKAIVNSKIIEGYAFCGCKNLTEVTLPSTLTNMGKAAFYGCSSLTSSITIPEGITAIGAYTFSGCKNLTEVTLPSTLTSIGEYAFYNCEVLTEIALPSTLTSIGEYAFYGCSSITSITIPEGITAIGRSTFDHCERLIEITLPSTLTSIGQDAFGNSSIIYEPNIPIKSITINAITPPTMIGNTFRSFEKIYVPASSVEAYKTAWELYASKITAIV